MIAMIRTRLSGRALLHHVATHPRRRAGPCLEAGQRRGRRRTIRERDGVLEARVDSSAWCQTLRLRAPQLLDALARELGDDAPRALWLRLG